MRLAIAAIGKLKDSGERDLFDRYASRLNAMAKASALGPLESIELGESRAQSAAERMAEEAERLLKAAAKFERMVTLDENGRSYSSEVFSGLMRKNADQGASSMIFLIGGPDGHGAGVREKADFTLSLSRMTPPHGLARVVLVEQLYRAATIITRHPYHRV